MGDLTKLLILEACWFGELSIVAITVTLAHGRQRQEDHFEFQASQSYNIARLHLGWGKKEGRKSAGSGVGSKAEVKRPAE